MDEDEIQALGPFSGDPHSRAMVYVWGDSHAMAILPAVEVAASKLGFVCYASTRYTTPPLLEGFARLRPPPKMAWDQEGPSWNDAVFDDLKRKANQYEPSIVVLAGLWRDYSVEEQFEAAYLATITRIQSIGVDRIIVFRQVPTFHQFSPKPFYSPISVFHAKISTSNLVSSFVAVDDYQKMRSHLNLFFYKLKERGIEVIDALDVLPQDKGRFTAVIGSAESRTPLFS